MSDNGRERNQMSKYSSLLFLLMAITSNKSFGSYADGLRQGYEVGSNAGKAFSDSYAQAYAQAEASRLALERKRLQRIEQKNRYGTDSVNKLYNMEKNSDAIYLSTLRSFTGN